MTKYAAENNGRINFNGRIFSTIGQYFHTTKGYFSFFAKTQERINLYPQIEFLIII